tara:strand:- start:2774 stop:2926 length:153 start_codon:yes stop_codon:yes gene_type:complete
MMIWEKHVDSPGIHCFFTGADAKMPNLVLIVTRYLEIVDLMKKIRHLDRV